jgi:UDP-N-acetylglucosamine acyltransferase
MPVVIDSSARVSAKARLGENVRIGPYCVIGDDVVVGDGSVIDSHVVIHKLTTIGKECRIAPFASLGSRPQDLKYNDEPTTLAIGDGCDIREYVTMSRGTVEHGATIVGSCNLFMANAHVAHDCTVGDHCVVANSVALAGHVTVGNWVVIGGLTPIHQFCRIGDHTMLGGGFRAVKDVPPYIRAGREPLVYEGINIVGLRRRGFSAEAIALIDKAYMLIYQSGLNVSQAVARVKQELSQTSEIRSIIDFIETSKRGILTGPRHRE